jgi:CRP-like cAMP-binding protein
LRCWSNGCGGLQRKSRIHSAQRKAKPGENGNLPQNGRKLLVRFAGPGDLVGKIARLDGGERSSTATAVTGVEALTLSRRDCRAIAAGFPDLHEAAVAHPGALLRGTIDRLVGLALPASRPLCALCPADPSAEERRGSWTFRDAQPEGQPDHLGLPVGAIRPELNRMLQDLREQDALKQDGPGWHRNGAALRLIAEQHKIFQQRVLLYPREQPAS